MGISQALGPDALRAGVVDDTASRPQSPFEGQLIFQKDTNQLLVYNGSAWVMIGDSDQPPSLQLTKTQTVGSGVSSVTVSDAFSDDFEVYQITWTGGTMSTSTAMKMRLNNITSTNYYGFLVYSSVSSGSPVGAVDNANTDWVYAGGGNPDQAGVNCFVENPFQTKFKFIRNSSVTYGITTSGALGVYNGFTNVTTSCTGFILTPFSGTMTGGTVRVYGYRKS